MPRRSSEVLSVQAKSFADYAAIAVAPLLIFLMISSLANFLMLIFYHGPYPLRVAWVVLMFTMGFVAIARVAIEQDRVYSLGYAVVLGFAGWVAMTRFVGSPIFSGFILLVIAYLADRIVNDCTLIDDTVDASGQGLTNTAKRRIYPFSCAYPSGKISPRRIQEGKLSLRRFPIPGKNLKSCTGK